MRTLFFPKTKKLFLAVCTFSMLICFIACKSKDEKKVEEAATTTTTTEPAKEQQTPPTDPTDTLKKDTVRTGQNAPVKN